MNFICFNGEMLSQKLLFTPQNRCFKYGDGLFETIKVFRGIIMLEEFHFDRLFTGLGLLKILAPNNFTREALVQKITALCSLNRCLASARVRLAVYRDEGNKAGFVIEANSLDVNVNQLNKTGWAIDIYPFSRKSCDAFSNLKSANYLPYVMAELFAKEMNCEESILLNTENNLCDASKANIFLLVKDEVYTPALHQGCVNGVKRRFIIEEFKKRGIVTHQQVVDEQLLSEADEVFLTNAINDIRWVKSFRDKTYADNFIVQFHKEIFSTIYH